MDYVATIEKQSLVARRPRGSDVDEVKKKLPGEGIIEAQTLRGEKLHVRIRSRSTSDP
jgi:hypothetical protein